MVYSHVFRISRIETQYVCNFFKRASQAKRARRGGHDEKSHQLEWETRIPFRDLDSSRLCMDVACRSDIPVSHHDGLRLKVTPRHPRALLISETQSAILQTYRTQTGHLVVNQHNEHFCCPGLQVLSYQSPKTISSMNMANLKSAAYNF